MTDPGLKSQKVDANSDGTQYDCESRPYSRGLGRQQHLFEPVTKASFLARPAASSSALLSGIQGVVIYLPACAPRRLCGIGISNRVCRNHLYISIPGWSHL